MPKNDFTASAGISMEQWKKDIATMNESLASVAKTSEKTSGVLSRMANSAVIGGAVKLFSDFGNAILQTGRKAGDVDDEFTALYGNVRKSGEQISTAQKVWAAFVSIPKAVGLKNLGVKQLEDNLAINRAIDKQVGSYEQAIEKLTQLNKLRSSETVKTKSDNIGRIENAIFTTTKEAAAMMQKMVNAQADLSAGMEGRLKAEELEIQYAEKMASIDEKLKDSEGQRTEEQEALYKAAAALAKVEFERAKKENDLATIQEGNLATIASLTAKTGIEFKDQDKLAEKRVTLAEQELDFAKQTLGATNAKTQALAAHVQQLKLSRAEMQNSHDREIQAAQDRMRAMDSELTGNKLIADLEKNRSAYALQIAEARRAGNKQLEVALVQQQGLGRVNALVEDQMKTPQQRAADRRQQDAQNAAERIVLRRELSGKATQFADGRMHVSPATEKLRKEFLARMNLPGGGAGAKGPAINAAALNITGTTVINGVTTVMAMKGS